MTKLLLKALPLILLLVGNAIHGCCACPMEFHDHEVDTTERISFEVKRSDRSLKIHRRKNCLSLSVLRYA